VRFRKTRRTGKTSHCGIPGGPKSTLRGEKAILEQAKEDTEEGGRDPVDYEARGVIIFKSAPWHHGSRSKVEVFHAEQLLYLRHQESKRYH